MITVRIHYARGVPTGNTGDVYQEINNVVKVEMIDVPTGRQVYIEWVKSTNGPMNGIIPITKGTHDYLTVDLQSFYITVEAKAQ